MITLYRKSNDEIADRVEDQFKDLVLAYQIRFDESLNVCFIMDGDNRIEPGEPLDAWFRQLTTELSWSRSLSGDGCFIDPQSGKVC
jgi:hypothetical protein